MEQRTVISERVRDYSVDGEGTDDTYVRVIVLDEAHADEWIMDQMRSMIGTGQRHSLGLTHMITCYDRLAIDRLYYSFSTETVEYHG